MHPWLRVASKGFLQDVYLRNRFIWRLPAGSRKIALTFDDGPDPSFTPQVLDLLAQVEAKATFFVIGRQVARYPDLAMRIVREGHAIGGHTYEHRVILGLSDPDLLGELTRGRHAILDATGVDSDMFRPPRGEIDFQSLRRIVRLGYRVVHWSKTYGDFRGDGTDSLLARVRADPVSARDIVLFHDNNASTVEALKRLMPTWRLQEIVLQRL